MAIEVCITLPFDTINQIIMKDKFWGYYVLDNSEHFSQTKENNDFV